MTHVVAGESNKAGRALLIALAIACVSLAALLAADRGDARAGATCFGKPATIVGTNGSDVISKKLTRGKDIVAARGGNDVIKASSTRNNHGEDIYCGGSGNDDILGNNERNKLIGDQGDDELNAGPDNDLLIGDNANPNGREGGVTGNDELGGAGGKDFMVGDNYASGKAGGASPDRRLLGANGNDTLIGDSASTAGDATGGANDHLEGADHNDRVIGDSYAAKGAASGGGKDEVNAGPGNDLGVGDSFTNTGTASGSGDDKVAAADGGDAGATCKPGTCDDAFYGDSFAVACATRKIQNGMTVMIGCARVTGGGIDQVTTDQGNDFMNGGSPDDPDLRGDGDKCKGGSGRGDGNKDVGTRCELYPKDEVDFVIPFP